MNLWDWLFRRRLRAEELDEEAQVHRRMASQKRTDQGRTAEPVRAFAVRDVDEFN
jgi:hypothetical protein